MLITSLSYFKITFYEKHLKINDEKSRNSRQIFISVLDEKDLRNVKTMKQSTKKNDGLYRRGNYNLLTAPSSEPIQKKHGNQIIIAKAS